METVNKIPVWFWIAIGIIVLATITAITYCNRSKKQTANELIGVLNNEVVNQDTSTTTTETNTPIETQRQNIFSTIPYM